MRVKIYAEGGGEGQLIDTQFRESWSSFFTAAGLAGHMPRIIRGKGRERTFDLFVTAVRNPRPGELPLLLVDSEDRVKSGSTAWQHLKSRDHWDRPDGAAEDQVFLMVTVMETWFLADRALLRRYFGGALREQHLRAWPALEDVPKETIFKALDQATAGCAKPYAKGKVSWELLAKLSPQSVEAACPHAKRLMDRLRSIA